MKRPCLACVNSLIEASGYFLVARFHCTPHHPCMVRLHEHAQIRAHDHGLSRNLLVYTFHAPVGPCSLPFPEAWTLGQLGSESPGSAGIPGSVSAARNGRKRLAVAGWPHSHGQWPPLANVKLRRSQISCYSSYKRPHSLPAATVLRQTTLLPSCSSDLVYNTKRIRHHPSCHTSRYAS